MSSLLLLLSSERVELPTLRVVLSRLSSITRKELSDRAAIRSPLNLMLSTWGAEEGNVEFKARKQDQLDSSHTFSINLIIVW
jgi:hypothetical protein